MYSHILLTKRAINNAILMKNKDDYYELSANLVKSAIASKGLKYPAVIDKMNKLGFKTNYSSFTAKMQRKTLPLWYVMQISKAIGMKVQIVNE